MKFAIICEGCSDVSVIRNVLKGALGTDKSDTIPLVPELEYDETDLSQMREEQFCNWTIVKQHCLDRTKINDFLENIEGERYIIIHLDTDMRAEIGYEVFDPEGVNTKEDIELLCDHVKSKMQDWLGDNPPENVLFAIAVQEIDAWVLTIYDDKQKETGLLLNTKEKLFTLLNKTLAKKDRKVLSMNDDKLNQYAELSKAFRKEKQLKTYTKRNHSLLLFYESLKSIEP